MIFSGKGGNTVTEREMAKLIELGNRAKDIGAMAIANLAFCAALNGYFKETWKEKPAFIFLTLETSDGGRASLEATYFDILHIETIVEDDSGEPRAYDLCIPLSMLSLLAAATAVKRVTATFEQEKHNRARRQAQPGEATELVNAILNMVGAESAMDAVDTLFDPEDPSDYSAVLDLVTPYIERENDC